MKFSNNNHWELYSSMTKEIYNHKKWLHNKVNKRSYHNKKKKINLIIVKEKLELLI